MLLAYAAAFSGDHPRAEELFEAAVDVTITGDPTLTAPGCRPYPR